MTSKICAVIATYNHYKALPKTIETLQKEDLKIFIIDDGSNEEAQKELQKIIALNPKITLFRLDQNSGKGAAVEAGLKLAQENGFTHAFQIDADGQHSLESLKNLIIISKSNPQAMISGHPIYDHSIPLGRRIGRWFTHIWVWIETLSFRITDTMCGFRIYPIQETCSLLNKENIGKRMDFDVEIMVRLFWEGVPVIMSPVQVIYPEDNHSNFNIFWDNWRLTKMHTRLVLKMLLNLPTILSKRSNYKNLDLSNEAVHWAMVQERGSFFGIFFFAKLYQILGRTFCLVAGSPVVLYFYLTGKTQRKASHDFLRRVFNRQVGFLESFKHFMNFFGVGLDKVAAWSGKLDRSSLDIKGVEQFTKMMQKKRGGIIFVSHLGNMEFCRAVSQFDHKQRMHILLHTANSQHFNRMLKVLNPNSNLNIIEVSSIGADTMLFLKERLEQGDWLAIAADRIPVQNAKSPSHRITYASFLGEDAPFSQGPYILASLLECPVYVSFAVRHKGSYRLHIELFSKKITMERAKRSEALQEYVQKFATILESHARKYPYQWFNFFDFWDKK